MKEIITNLLGVYTPLTAADGTIISSVAGIDWTWIIGAVAFLLFLYCFFKIVGVLIRG